MSKEKPHLFLPSEAEELKSVEKAILLYNMRYWLDYHKNNGTHIYDGYVWIYNSAKSLAKQFPYMTERSISRWLTELEEKAGIIKSANYNKLGIDKTKWYTIPSEYAIRQNDEPISQNGEWMTQNGEAIPNVDSNVDSNKEVIDKSITKKEIDSSSACMNKTNDERKEYSIQAKEKKEEEPWENDEDFKEFHYAYKHHIRDERDFDENMSPKVCYAFWKKVSKKDKALIISTYQQTLKEKTIYGFRKYFKNEIWKYQEAAPNLDATKDIPSIPADQRRYSMVVRDGYKSLPRTEWTRGEFLQDESC